LLRKFIRGDYKLSDKKIYAVRKGRQTGLFETWPECEAQIKGFKGAEYKSFKESEKDLALKYVEGDNSVPSDKYIYAVRIGRKVGIFNSWEECLEQVKGYPHAEYKKFKKEERDLADRYLHGEDVDRKSVEGLTPEEEMNLSLKYAKEYGTIVIYTDGSFDAETGKVGFGYIQVKEDGEIGFKGSGFEENEDKKKLRNVAGEIDAILKALEHFEEKEGIKRIVFFVDYVGLKNWANGLWKAENEYTQKYKEEIEKHRQKREIDFVIVKGHTKNKYNKKVDELVREALNL